MTVVSAQLERLLAPRSIAVVGASADPAKPGNALVEALAGFPGDLHPVNPRGGEIGGRSAATSLAALESPVDLAVAIVPGPAVPGVIEEAAALGVGGVVVCSSGFAEAGADGASLQARIAAIAGESELRVLGPNTSGFVNPAAGVFANFMPTVRELRPGPVGVVAQSGGANLMLSFLLHAEGTGVSVAVGLGNAVDVGFEAMLRHLAEDEATRAIALHVEGVEDGRALIDAVADLTPHKPVVVLKVGRADVGDFARSHTGSMIGDWRLSRAALTQAGAVVVDSPTELVDAVRALASVRLRPGPRPGVGLITGQAGPGLMMADQLRGAGVDLPELGTEARVEIGKLLPPLTYQRNPVDTGRPSEAFAGVASAVASDPAIDALLVYALQEPPTELVVEALAEGLATGVLPPSVFATGGLASETEADRARLAAARIPAYLSPDRAATAVQALVADARARDLVAADKESEPGIAVPGGALDELAAKRVVASLGVKVPAGVACLTREDVWATFEQVAKPLVVKVLDARISHKTELGAVRVGVATEADLEAALDAIDAAVPDRAGYLVEEMATGGTELILGASRDPVYGPTVLLAPGGVAAELATEPLLRLAPLGLAAAAAMVEELPQTLRDGHRGDAPIPVDELSRVVSALGATLAANDHVGAIEINPLRVTAAGLVALDALVLPREER